MKMMKKFAVIAVSWAVMLSMASIQTFAATVTQDGLEVTLTADKAEYGKDEQITATLTVENTGKEAVTNVTLENVIPEGYQLADGFDLTKQTEKLNSGDKAELTVTYTVASEFVESSDNESSSDNSVVKTGNNIFSVVLALVLLSVSAVLIVISVKKKKGKGFLSVAVCISVLGTIIAVVPFDTQAADNGKTISITEKIIVDGDELDLSAYVKYDLKGENQESSEKSEISEISDTSLDEADKYYNENAEVVSVTKANESADVLSDQEVTNLLLDRGFDMGLIFTDYDIYGNYLDEMEVENKSDEKHPIYKMLYESKSELLWNVYIINGAVFAYPVSYNLVSDRQAVLLITETDTVISYDYLSNQFYETIPKESSVIVRKVDKIDKETLDTFTIGGLSEL